MSGSKGSPNGDDNDFGARIGASIGAGNPVSKSPDIKVKQTLAPIQARPVATNKKPVNRNSNLASNRPLGDDLDDDLDESKLPQRVEGPTDSAGGSDLLWPVTIGFVLIILTGSLLVFLSVSRYPDEEITVRATPDPSVSSENIFENQGTLTLGDGKGPEPSPSPSPSASVIAQSTPLPQQALPTQNPVLLQPPQPLATSPPISRPVVTPPPVQRQTQILPPKLPAATAKPVETDNFQVQAGPYDDRSAAEAGSSELSQLGKAVKIIEDNGKFWLNVGSQSTQEEALALAEQAVQQGHQVTVKKR